MMAGEGSNDDGRKLKFYGEGCIKFKFGGGGSGGDYCKFKFCGKCNGGEGMVKDSNFLAVGGVISDG